MKQETLDALADAISDVGEILPAIKKWRAYWKDYWLKRKTRDAYEKDWACETTIPADRSAPQGNW